MDLWTMLSFIVTGLGVLLVIFTLLAISMGKKLVKGKDDPQEIEFKGLKLRTNSMIMLLLVSVIVAVSPLLLMAYIQTHPGNTTDTKSTSTTMDTIFVVGQVNDGAGKALGGATIKAINTDKNEIIGEKTTEDDGTFEMKLQFNRNKDRIKLITEKGGYRKYTIVLGTEQVSYPSVLIRQGGV
jgi:hypothetical protein